MKWTHILVVLFVIGLCAILVAVLLSPTLPETGSIPQQAGNMDEHYSEMQSIKNNDSDSEESESGYPEGHRGQAATNNPRHSNGNRVIGDKEAGRSSADSGRGGGGTNAASRSRHGGSGGMSYQDKENDERDNDSSLKSFNKLKPGIRIITRDEFQDYIDSVETPPGENDEDSEFDDPKKGIVAGYVVDESGAPVDNAKLILSLEQTSYTTDKSEDFAGFPKTAMTDANGRFWFTDLPLLSYSIMIECRGFLPEYFAAIRLQEEGEVYLQVVMRNSLLVGGMVIDGDGNPVEGARVTSTYHIEVGPDFISETISDSGGNFILPVREGSSNKVEATKSGYSPAKLLAVSQGKMDCTLVLAQIPTGLVTGRVVDSSTGNPIGEIILDGETVYAPDGFFEVERAVSNKAQTMIVDAPGWQSKNIRFTLKESATVDVGEISLQIELHLRGLVVIAESEPPEAIVGAAVRFESSSSDSQTSATNAEGVFLFDGVTPGTVTLEISAPGYYPQTKQVVIEDYDPENPDSREVFILINLARGGFVVGGTVTNTQTGNPVADVSLTVVEIPALAGLTGEDGGYIIEDISLGSFRVRASKPGYVTLVSDTLIASSEGTSVICNFALEPGGFHGKLLCGGNAVPAGVTVNMWKKTDGPIESRLAADSNLQQNFFTTTTDDEGGFALLDIPDGIYFLHVPTYQLWPKEVEVDCSSSEIVNFELPGISELRGKISYADGSPVANTSLYLHSGDNDYSIAGYHTDEQGNYVIKHVARLNYALSIIKSIADQSAQHVVKCTVQSAPQQVVDVKFPPLSASISGRLTDENGQPKSGVQIGVEYLDSPHRAILAGWVFTDDGGNYSLPRLEPGRHVVRTAWTDDEVVFSDIIELKTGESKEVNLIAPKVTGTRVRGHMITADGAPLLGSFIFAINEDGRQSGNFFGQPNWRYASSFNLKGLTPGNYTLVFTAVGCRKKSVDISVTTDMSGFIVTMERE